MFPLNSNQINKNTSRWGVWLFVLLIVGLIGGFVFQTQTIRASNEQQTLNQHQYLPIASNGKLDIAISKSADKVTAASGDTVIFTLTIENVGGSVATDVVISDTIPSEFQITNVSMTGITGIYTPTGRTHLFTAAQVAPNSVGTVQVTTVLNGPTHDHMLLSSAVVRAAHDLNHYNNTAGASVLMVPSTATYTNIFRCFANNGTPQLDALGNGQVIWEDYNGDSALDLLVAGVDDNGPRVDLYDGNGSNQLTKVGTTNLLGTEFSRAAYGDYDGDGDLGVVVIGRDGNAVPATTLYQNDGSGGFSEDTSIPLLDVMYGDVAWGDYDGDGDLDLLLLGVASDQTGYTKLYNNMGNGNWREDGNTNLPGRLHGSAAWGDYDRDGDLDVVLIGNANDNRPYSKIYQNDGAGRFTHDVSIVFPDMAHGTVDWGDYDNDDDLDLLLTGQTSDTGTHTLIYQNDGSGNLQNANISLQNLSHGGAAWGDYDGDGDLDIVLSSNSGGSYYENRGGNQFVRFWGFNYSGTNTSVAWGDYDGDGDVDIVTSGTTSVGSYFSKIDRNVHCPVDLTISNRASEVTAGAGDTVIYSWEFENRGDSIANDIVITGTIPQVMRVTNVTIDTPSMTYSSIDNTYRFTLDQLAAKTSGTIQVTAVVDEMLPLEQLLLSRAVIHSPDELVLNNNRAGASLLVNPASKSGAASGCFVEDQMFEYRDVSIEWADYNDDGVLDMLMGGVPISNSSADASGIYLNDGSGQFSYDASSGLPTNMYSGITADYDGDGDLDIAIHHNYGDSPYSLYLNNGDGSYSLDTRSEFPTNIRRWTWGDYNGDGVLDILLSTSQYNSALSKDEHQILLYQNDGTGQFSRDVYTHLPAAELVWDYLLDFELVDYDGDHDLDLVIVAELGHEQLYRKAYRNDGAQSFVEDEALNSVLAQLNITFGEVIPGIGWGDYDGDGDIDFTLSGIVDLDAYPRDRVARVYQNDGIGNYVPVMSAITLPYLNAPLWADHDGDGDLDMLLDDRIYKNDGNGNLDFGTHVIPYPSSGLNLNANWADYNGDGVLDVLGTSSTPFFSDVHLYKQGACP